MPWRGPNEPGEFPTLGHIVADWFEANLIIPDGPNQGAPFTLYDEQYLFLLRYYRLIPQAIDGDGSDAFQFHGGALIRPQKWGKDPFGAGIGCAEALGPVRFAGWDAAGEPVGMPMSTPYIQCAGNAEEQCDNTWRPIVAMLREGPLASLPGLDVGDTRIVLPSGGRMEPVTASSRARQGARVTFCTMTEALALHTPVPTPTGWTTMGEIRAGDQILGADGLPTTVVKAADVQTDRLCFRVTFKDGTSVIASDGHLWSTRISGHPQKHTVARVRSTADIVADGRKMNIPVAPPMKSADIELPIDPYILGLWLGDGDNASAVITSGDQDRAETIALIESRGYTAKDIGDFKIYVSLPGVRKGRHQGFEGRPLGLVTRLRQQNLLGNKHIPMQYLRAGTQQRIDLLRGLMDSDGCATKEGYVFFAQTSKQLTDDFYELVRSLGQIATVRWSADPKSRQGGYYRVGFQPRWQLQPFSLPRKAERVVPRRHPDGWTAIKSIEPVPTEPVRCIAVDAPDHLFLAGDGWHVTHNTQLMTETSGGVKLAKTLKRNVGGMDGRWLEISNAWDPAERSVLQRTVEAKDRHVYVDYRPPRKRVDLEDDEALAAEVEYVYGDSGMKRGGHVRTSRIIRDIRNVATGEGEARRYFLNEVTVGSRDAVDMLKWATQARRGETLAAGERVALGFHGSQTRDATSLCAARMSDGRLFHLRTWEKPYGHVGDWQVPRGEVNQAVDDAFAGYQVSCLFATPATWQDEVNKWAGLYPKRVLELWMNSEMRMDQVIERFRTAHMAGETTHDGSAMLRDHTGGAALANGKHRPTAEEREPGQPEHYQRVVRKSWAQSISAFVAALLAYEARGWAMEHREEEVGEPQIWLLGAISG